MYIKIHDTFFPEKFPFFASEPPGRAYNSTNDLWSVCKLKDQSSKCKVAESAIGVWIFKKARREINQVKRQKVKAKKSFTRHEAKDAISWSKKK